MIALLLRPRWLIVAATVATAALLAWLLWPAPAGIPGADRVRQYLNLRACLLTGADGVQTPQAAAAWAGMEAASLSSRAMVSYLPVTGTASQSTAQPYLASLVQRQCGVIVAVGKPQVAAVTAEAARFGQVHFVVITSRAAASSITRIPPQAPAQLRAAVQNAVSAAIAAR